MKITDRCAAQGDSMLYISDFTPLKSADADSSIANVTGLDVDYICVAYNPGKVVRVASNILAYTIKQQTDKENNHGSYRDQRP